MGFYRDMQQNVDAVSKERQSTIAGDSRTQVHSIFSVSNILSFFNFRSLPWAAYLFLAR